MGLGKAHSEKSPLYFLIKLCFEHFTYLSSELVGKGIKRSRVEILGGVRENLSTREERVLE
jgi:hypothetical protein